MQFYTMPDQVAVGLKSLSSLFSTSSPSVPVTKARAIILSCSGTGPIRFGDQNIGAAQGLQIPASVSPTILRTTVGDVTDWFDLTTTYIFVPAGTTASVIIGK